MKNEMKNKIPILSILGLTIMTLISGGLLVSSIIAFNNVPEEDRIRMAMGILGGGLLCIFFIACISICILGNLELRKSTRMIVGLISMVLTVLTTLAIACWLVYIMNMSIGYDDNTLLGTLALLCLDFLAMFVVLIELGKWTSPKETPSAIQHNPIP